MAKKQIIGVMACPECGFPDAEVKPQKNGLLYRFCPDCNAQYFPRTAETSERLAVKMTPVSVTGTEQEGAPSPAQVPEPEPKKKPASRGFSLGGL